MLEFLQSAFALVTPISLFFTVLIGLMIGALFIWELTEHVTLDFLRIIYAGGLSTLAFFALLLALRLTAGVDGWERIIGTSFEFLVFQVAIAAGMVIRNKFRSIRRRL